MAEVNQLHTADGPELPLLTAEFPDLAFSALGREGAGGRGQQTSATGVGLPRTAASRWPTVEAPPKMETMKAATRPFVPPPLWSASSWAAASEMAELAVGRANTEELGMSGGVATLGVLDDEFSSYEPAQHVHGQAAGHAAIMANPYAERYESVRRRALSSRGHGRRSPPTWRRSGSSEQPRPPQRSAIAAVRTAPQVRMSADRRTADHSSPAVLATEEEAHGRARM